MSFFDIKIDKSNFITIQGDNLFILSYLNDHFENLLPIQKEILDEFFEKFV